MTSNVNGKPECRQCGKCCHISMIAMTIEEAERIFAYAEENGIEPRDLGEGVCPWLADDNRCRIWPARSQTCCLHNCERPYFDTLAENPDAKMLDDKWLVDLRKVFLFRDFEDPRKGGLR